MYSQKKRNFIRYFDIFAPTFKQKIDQDHYEKKTTFGGLFSILILLASISYSSYLLTLFSDGRIQPKYNSYEEYVIDTISFDLKSNQIFVMVQTSLGVSLPQLELKTGIQYFDIYLELKQKDGIKSQRLYASLFDQDDKNDLYRFGDLTHPLTYKLNNEQIIFNGASIEIKLNKCSGNHLRQNCKCATDEQYNEMLKHQILTSVMIVDNSFSIKENREIQRPFAKYTFNRSNERAALILGIKLQETDVSKGFFLQDNQHYKQISDIQQLEFYSNQSLTPSEINDDASFLEIILFLDSTVKYTQIQYPILPEIFAQAWSVISILMLSGYLIKLKSQSTLAQDFLGIQLKYYYKKTAQKLFKMIPSCTTSHPSRNTHKELSSVADAQSVINQNEQIQNTSFKKNFKKYFQLSEFQKQVFYFNFKLHLKEYSYLSYNQQDHFSKKNSDQQTDIFNFFRYTDILNKYLFRDYRRIVDKQQIYNQLNFYYYSCLLANILAKFWKQHFATYRLVYGIFIYQQKFTCRQVNIFKDHY